MSPLGAVTNSGRLSPLATSISCRSVPDCGKQNVAIGASNCGPASGVSAGASGVLAAASIATSSSPLSSSPHAPARANGSTQIEARIAERMRGL
jgi:hypothetical protein